MFLGNYINKGLEGIEVLIYLIALKINFPKKIQLLRGNHETRQMTENFIFRKECLEKYDLEIYENIMEMFDSLPLVCIVNDLYFCVHGGISPELRELADINTKINRF